MPAVRSAVTFDLWHTLVYLEPSAEEAYMNGQMDAATRVLKESDPVGGRPDWDEPRLRSAFEKEYRGAVVAANEGRSVTPAEQLTRAARVCGRRPEPDAYLTAVAHLIEGAPFQMATDALLVLGELRDEGYGIGVISNTVGEPGRFLRPILRTLGFDSFVQTYIFSDEQIWAKPAPEIFHLALDSLGSDPSVSVHVGDGWSDMEGAQRAGMRGRILFTGNQDYGEQYRKLFVRAGDHEPPSEPRARTLPEVIPIVRRILPLPRNG